ncbi:lasso peptide biosynthesis PqqD family chaperone [Streptomyces swartbergensis]|uniref:PqqD family protein n=1 Tax=Streptomyces swartbergensis TaxID=487165 RepID=A0A243RKM9_9ACTN|nr:lasso peptide biosynthesis PqqD family chaperone [Streptomyces swartbergensis]OUC95449.1 hypothetical protein CA983_33365 [Streptomyces swartbergensis]
MAAITLRPEVTAVDTGQTMVLLNQHTGRYWQLNATGALILRALLRDGTPTTAAAALIRAHPQAAERADRDVDDLLTALRTHHLLSD